MTLLLLEVALPTELHLDIYHDAVSTPRPRHAFCQDLSSVLRLDTASQYERNDTIWHTTYSTQSRVGIEPTLGILIGPLTPGERLI